MNRALGGRILVLGDRSLGRSSITPMLDLAGSYSADVFPLSASATPAFVGDQERPSIRASRNRRHFSDIHISKARGPISQKPCMRSLVRRTRMIIRCFALLEPVSHVGRRHFRVAVLHLQQRSLQGQFALPRVQHISGNFARLLQLLLPLARGILLTRPAPHL